MRVACTAVHSWWRAPCCRLLQAATCGRALIQGFHCDIQDYAESLAHTVDSAMRSVQQLLADRVKPLASGSAAPRDCADSILDFLACVLRDVTLVFRAQVGNAQSRSA